MSLGLENEYRMNLNQVTVGSKDVERSVRFYQQLGLRLIVFSPPRYARFECPEGDSTFSIHQLETDLPCNGTVVYFESASLDAEVNRLLSEGIVFDSMLEDQPWLWREASLRDPDGNKIILYSAGENRRNPPWRIQ